MARTFDRVELSQFGADPMANADGARHRRHGATLSSNDSVGFGSTPKFPKGPVGKADGFAFFSGPDRSARFLAPLALAVLTGVAISWSLLRPATAWGQERSGADSHYARGVSLRKQGDAEAAI